MKIMQIVPRMEVGGVERGVIDFANYFKDKDDEIIVVSGGGRLTHELKRLNTKHYKLNVYKKSPFTLLSVRKLRKIIKEENIDVVHARSRVPAWIAFMATRKSDVEFITTAHGFYSSHFLSSIMGWGKFVICPSKVIARHMQESFCVDYSRIRIIPRWVDLEKFKFAPKRDTTRNVTLLSIGRISPSKGYEYLIRAMRRIVRVNPYVRLDIVGEATGKKKRYLNYLKSLLQRYSLNYYVRFLGYRSDVEDMLRKASVLVVPSVVEESFGRVIIEAMAVGVPVIATKVGAFPEIIEHRKNGFLVPPRDDEALKDTIMEFLENRRLVERIVINARKRVEREYVLGECAERTRKVYMEAKNLKRILVIKISSLGDIILVIPSLKAIKEKYPQSELTLLVLKKYASLFHGCPFVDRIIGLDSDYKKISSLVNISGRLCRLNFDYIIDFQNNLASHVIAFLSFPRRSFGFSRKLGFLLTHRRPFPEDKSVDPLSSQERILELVGIKFKKKELTFWNLPDGGVSLLDETYRYVGINVSASRKWETKNWPPEYIIKLIEMIYNQLPSFRVVLLGDSSAKEVSRKIESSVRGKIVNLCGRTGLRELVRVIRHLEAFITPDTASLHLAQCLGVPTIALFGPTNPSRHTVASKKLEVIYKKMDCSFCYRQRCPYRHNKCMREIYPREVFSRMKYYLRDSKNRESNKRRDRIK